MPTYEYRCAACGHSFERMQKISDDPLSECPECGEDEAERLISPGAGLVFKGSGFYATDYRKRESAPAGGDGGEGAGAPDAGGKPEGGAGKDRKDGADGEGS